MQHMITRDETWLCHYVSDAKIKKAFSESIPVLSPRNSGSKPASKVNHGIFFTVDGILNWVKKLDR